MLQSLSRATWQNAIAAVAVLSLSFFLGNLASQKVASWRAGSVLPDGIVAVTLVDGRTFFGTLEPSAGTMLRLHDVFYSSAGIATSTDIALIKMGTEFYRPEDWMQIDRAQILYIQPLDPESKIVQAMSGYVSSTE